MMMSLCHKICCPHKTHSTVPPWNLTLVVFCSRIMCIFIPGHECYSAKISRWQEKICRLTLCRHNVIYFTVHMCSTNKLDKTQFFALISKKKIHLRILSEYFRFQCIIHFLNISNLSQNFTKTETKSKQIFSAHLWEQWFHMEWRNVYIYQE